MSVTTRDTLDTPVLVIGAGPAGLSFALHLSQLLARSGPVAGIGPEDIYVIEKAEAVGMHTLSGAVFDPVALLELFPDIAADELPGVALAAEGLRYLTASHAVPIPGVSRVQQNHDCRLIALGEFCRWLAARAESAGVSILTGLSGADLLIKDGKVSGVRTGDRGTDRSGQRGAAYEPGADLQSRLAVLSEGAHGFLTRKLVERYRLDRDSNPQTYALGMKELWEVPAGRLAPGTVLHTMGYPLPQSMYGGGWLYAMDERHISLGLMVGLEYADAEFSPYRALQRMKRHPYLRAVLEGGSLLRYGAKTVATGGYWALPGCHAPGALMIGEGAGYLDTLRMKGIHLAMKTGMLAAETAFAHLTRGAGLEDLRTRIAASWVEREMWRARNFHQGFRKGMLPGLVHGLLQQASGGRGLVRRAHNSAGHVRMQPLTTPAAKIRYDADDRLTFDLQTAVYHSAVRHDENQPPHLLVKDPDICSTRCTGEFGNPCTRFCPAGVYEWETPDGAAGPRINAANCLHCKTCEIMDPYSNISWVPPESGGPRYEGM